MRQVEESEDYANEMSVSVNDGKRARRVSGTCFGKQPRLTRIRNYRLELAPEGSVLICTNYDKPGVVGRVGTMLGESGVNIAGMQLGRDEPGGKALFTLSLDAKPNAEILEKIRALDVIESVFLVQF